MFMSPNSDIDAPLYGGQCFLDCAEASAAGKCSIVSISMSCGATCGGGGADKLAYGPPENKVCFSESQLSTQLALLIAAVIAVPVLLVPIPLIELHQHNKKVAAYERIEEKSSTEEGAREHGAQDFSFGDAFIHQATLP